MIPYTGIETQGRKRLFTLPWICLWVACLVWGAGCAKKAPPPKASGAQKPYRIGSQWYRPIASAHGFRQKGLASWYGRKFHGRKTANGETYNMYALSAAHKTLPLGTWVRVKNLENMKTLDVRINDRGPFVRGRIIDLSYKAAKVLGVVGPGTARVEIVALGRSSTSAGPLRQTAVPIAYDRGIFTIQVGAFQNRQNAERLKQKLDRTYKYAHVVSYDSGQGIYYRVRVGRCTSLKEAESYEDILIRDGFGEATIVAEE